MSRRNRLQLFLNVIAIVGALILVKVMIHQFDFEFLVFDSLFPSVVASAVFIIGFMLSGLLPDFKEAERMPAEIRTALEGIHDDIAHFVVGAPEFDYRAFRSLLGELVSALETGLGPKAAHTGLESAIAKADKLTAYFAQVEKMGMLHSYVTRLRGQQDILRRSLYRISYIQKIEVLPSVHVLIQTLVVAALILLLFLKSDGTFGSAFVFGFVTYMFVYALHLVDVLEQPFRKGGDSTDDVSLFLLRDFAKKLEGSDATPDPAAIVTAAEAPPIAVPSATA